MNYQRKILNQTLFTFIVVNLVLALLLFLKPHLGKGITMTLGSAVFIISTIIIARIENLGTEVLGLESNSFLSDLKVLLMTIFIVFPLFLVANHFYQLTIMHRHFEMIIREGILANVINNLLLVAIPEEIFFRGYLQGQFSRVYTSKRFMGFLSPANLITSILFAIGHFFTNPRIDRLAVFFPSILFGYVRDVRGNIYPSIILHWISNFLMYIILGMYK